MRRLGFFVCLLLLLPSVQLFAEVHTLLVLSQDDHTLYELNSASGQVVKQLVFPGAPRDALFSWDEKTLFVSVPDAGYVAIVDAATLQEKGRVESAEFKKSAAGVAGSPMALATTPDGHKLYVTIEGGLMVFDSKLLVYDLKFGMQGAKKITVAPKDGQHIRYQGTTDKLYYPHRRENVVIVVDTNTDTVLKSIPVPGGPDDVVFAPGNEAWVTSGDGSISIIDTGKDVVARTIPTPGKGASRIAIAQDVRYIAATHADTGDVTVFHPITKAIVATIKTGRSPLSLGFVPDAKNPTNLIYVVNSADSDVAIVDIGKQAVSSHWKAGKVLANSIVHYTFPHGWGPPREGSARRLMETDLFTAYANAMFMGDVSPVHEHRSDLAVIFTGTGVAKIGCWDPKCPPEVVTKNAFGLTYNNSEGIVGNFAAITRGALHQEEGGSPTPRRGIFFDLKNNYYRQTTPPKKSAFEGLGLRKIGESPRAVAWDLTLTPGKPFDFPAADVALVYLGGGLIRVTRDGKPEIINRYFNEWDWEQQPRRMEALTQAFRVAIMEFK